MHGRAGFVLCTYMYICDHAAPCGRPKMRTKIMTIQTSAHGQGSSTAEPWSVAEISLAVASASSAENWGTEWKSPARNLLRWSTVKPSSQHLVRSSSKGTSLSEHTPPYFLPWTMCLRGGGPLVCWCWCAGSLARQRLLGESVQLDAIIKWANGWQMAGILRLS